MIEIITLIIAAGGLLLSIGVEHQQNSIANTGSSLRSKLGLLAKELSKKISNNSNLLAQIYQAYQTKNTNLLNRIFTGMGFGPRMESLVKSIDSNDANYAKQLKQLNSTNSELESQLNEVNTAINNTGASFKGNDLAQKTYEKFSKQLENENKTEDLNQNVQGGITNAN